MTRPARQPGSPFSPLVQASAWCVLAWSVLLAPAAAQTATPSAEAVALGESASAVIEAIAARHVAAPAGQQVLLQMLLGLNPDATPQQRAALVARATSTQPSEFANRIAEAAEVRLSQGESAETLRQRLRDSLSRVDSSLGWVPANALRVNQQLAENQYVGIGVAIATGDDACVFQQVFPRGPASRAGVIPGDRLLRVDGEDARKPLAEVVKMLRGPVGSEVSVQVAQPRQPPRDLVMTRDVVPIDTIEGLRRDEQENWRTEMEEPAGCLYLRVVNVAGSTAAELRQAVNRPEVRGAVLDLRTLAQGELDHLRLLADALLDEQQVGRVHRSDGVETLRTTQDHVLHGLPLVILVSPPESSLQMHWLARTLQRLRPQTEIVGVPRSEPVPVEGVAMLADGDGVRMPMGVLSEGETPPATFSQEAAASAFQRPAPTRNLGEDASFRAARQLLRIMLTES